jgi:hypothetical protein
MNWNIKFSEELRVFAQFNDLYFCEVIFLKQDWFLLAEYIVENPCVIFQALVKTEVVVNIK